MCSGNSNENIKISLVCVYNKRDLVNSMVDSAKAQTIGFENIDFVLIDNSSHKFKSAAEALNYGAKKAKSGNILFLHQDIEFVGDDALEYIIQYLDANPRTLVGAAGVKHKEKDDRGEIVSSMFAGPDKSQYSKESLPKEVFILDECLFGLKKEMFDNLHGFDEVLCDGWHLYAADLCLNALVNSYSVVALPLNQIWHKSNGNADKAYFDTQNALAKKYKKHFKIINTTNSFTYTNPFKRMLINIYRKLRY